MTGLEPREPLRRGTTVLRAVHAEDRAALVAASTDALVERYMLAAAEPNDTARAAWVEYVLTPPSASTARLAITAADDGPLLGTITLHLRDAATGEVGFWLTRAARGRGHATRALELVVEWAFAHLGLGRVEMLVDLDNAASAAVAERAGFVRETVLEDHLIGAGLRRDVARWAR